MKTPCSMVGCPYDAVGILTVKTERMPVRGFYPYCETHGAEWRRLPSRPGCRYNWRLLEVV